ncbi:tetratricopeptide repeat protein [Paraburkholderia caribensis]|uniref:tetratricopeptide repeat protein n=1 Tax=Paraburkholderia caribensis TaxID=75105 RepID=UPI001D05C70E|nr:tetratricopeptide repeat protein [Paraburkholderia caribensis]
MANFPSKKSLRIRQLRLGIVTLLAALPPFYASNATAEVGPLALTPSVSSASWTPGAPPVPLKNIPQQRPMSLMPPVPNARWSSGGGASWEVSPKESSAGVDDSFGVTAGLWNILLHRVPHWISKLKDVVANALMLAGLISVMTAFWWEWRRNVVVIDALDVPKDLADKGFSGVVLAQRIADEIHTFQRRAKNKAEASGVEIGGMQTDFQVPAANLSIKSLVRYVRQVLRRDEMRIRGEITTDGERYKLHLRTSSGRTTASRPPRTIKDFERLLKTGAEDVILLAAPLLAMQYRFLDEYNSSKFTRTLEAVKFNLSTTPRSQHKFSYTVWGNVLAVIGDIEGAFEKYKTALSIDKKHAPAYNGWGNTLRLRQDFDGAIGMYKAAIRYGRKYDVAMINMGLAFLAKKDHKAASVWFQRAMKSNPVNPSASLNLAITESDLGQTSEALRHIRHSLDVDPNSVQGYINLANVLRRQFQREHALSALKKALSSGFPLPNLYGVWGDVLLDESNFHGAISKYQEALRSSSQAVFAQIGIARCYVQLRDFESAETHASAAIRQAPRLPQGYIALAEVYLASRRFGEAMTQYTRAHGLDGGKVLANIGLARVERELYDFDSALERIAKALSAQPTSASAYVERGLVCTEMNRPKEATESFKRALEIDEYAIRALCGLGNLSRSRLRLDESEEYYASALRMDEKSVDALNGIAWTRLAQSRQMGTRTNVERRLAETRRRQALDSFDKAFSLNKNSESARLGRIATLSHLGSDADISTAWREARSAVEDMPSHPAGFLYMGILAFDECQRNGDEVLAIHAMACFGCALAQDKNHPHAQYESARVAARLGLAKEAVTRLSILIERNKYYVPAYLLKAEILLGLHGPSQEAWDVFESAALVDAESPEVFLRWGRNLKNHGLDQQAVSKFEQASRLAPSHPEIIRLITQSSLTPQPRVNNA